ncbi:uncharacterized protein AB675_1343 [Cyphellophora attinorum]|uniref:Elongator complex protein 6 n=1 Tax=Cyphellophora attinorum TaxID=1664694 RepID=A0A0N1NVJ3_9EURO|nr:uncharacterized protein AB675_1343 [Phialophora attinorum]KPI35140.1 hypothetical protein AB675_1343 [Phialophora attinorum]
MNVVTTKYEYYIDLLEDLTRSQQIADTTVIICLSRTDFLSHVAAQIHRLSTSEQPEDAGSPGDLTADVTESASSQHRFLVPTLQLLSVGQHMRLAYCPNIPSLRAYLSTYGSQQESTAPSRSRLIIVDLLALHHGTSEFTLQGLSRTLATAVSVASSASSDLALTECKDIRDPTHPDRGSRLWEAQVPLLSGSVRIGLEGSRWSGRALTIRKIASRWFQIEDEPRRGTAS